MHGDNLHEMLNLMFWKKNLSKCCLLNITHLSSPNSPSAEIFSLLITTIRKGHFKSIFFLFIKHGILI